MNSPHSRPPHTPTPQLLPSNLSTHHSSKTTHSNPSTYLSTDRLPSNLYILLISFFKFQDMFFLQFQFTPTRHQSIVVRMFPQQFNSIDIYLGLHRMASEIQLFLLKNTAAPLQEFHGSGTEVILTCFLVQCLVFKSDLCSYVLVCFVGSNLFPCGQIILPFLFSQIKFPQKSSFLRKFQHGYKNYFAHTQHALEICIQHRKGCCRTVTSRQHNCCRTDTSRVSIEQTRHVQQQHRILQNIHVQAAQSAVEQTRPGVAQIRHVQQQHRMLQNRHVQAAQSAVEQLRPGIPVCMLQTSYFQAAQSAVEQLRPDSTVCCKTVTFRQYSLLQNSYSQAAQSAVEHLFSGSTVCCRTVTSRQHSLLQNCYFQAAQFAEEQLLSCSTVCCRTVTFRTHSLLQKSYVQAAQSAVEQLRPGSTLCYRTVTFSQYSLLLRPGSTRQHSLLQNSYFQAAQCAVEQLRSGSTVCCRIVVCRIDTSRGSTGCYRTISPGAAHAGCCVEKTHRMLQMETMSDGNPTFQHMLSEKYKMAIIIGHLKN